MSSPPGPEEHLRQALRDLQAAQREFATTYGQAARADAAARTADEARAQAARWASLARAANKLTDEP